MAIRRLLIHLTFERTATSELGQPYTYHQVLAVDLVSEDVKRFLDQIPDDIDEHSSISVAILREDEKVIGYADGMAPCSEGEGWGEMKRMSEIENNYADAMRNTIEIFARRHYKRTKDDPPD